MHVEGEGNGQEATGSVQLYAAGNCVQAVANSTRGIKKRFAVGKESCTKMLLQ
jgi:hypothetical protein